MFFAFVLSLGLFDRMVLSEPVLDYLTAGVASFAEAADQKDLPRMGLYVTTGAIVSQGIFLDVVPRELLLCEVVHEKGC